MRLENRLLFAQKPFGIAFDRELAFRELEPFAGTGKSVFLALSFARVAGKEAHHFKIMAVLLVFPDKRSGDAEAGCDHLTLNSASFDPDKNVIELGTGDLLQRG